MSAAPPVPPRPSSAGGEKPPVPPLPPNYKPEQPSDHLVSPRPQRINPSVPANMARNLEYSLGGPPGFPSAMPTGSGPGARPLSWGGPASNDPYRHGPSPGPHLNYPSFTNALGPPPPSYPSPWSQPPSAVSAPTHPPPWQASPPGSAWNPNLVPDQSAWNPPRGPTSPAPSWNPPPPVSPAMTSPPPAWNSLPSSALPTPVAPQSHNRLSSAPSLSTSFASLSFSDPTPKSPTSRRTLPSLPEPQRQSPPQEPGQPPAVVVTLPTVASLATAAQAQVSADPSVKISWAKQVLQLVDRVQAVSDKPDISDPELVRLTDTAIQHIINISALAGTATSGQPQFIAEALYLRGTLQASGSFPAYFPKDPRHAFKDYEQAARLGFHTAWFKLGRDYESVNDPARARDCFERGAGLNETSCLYRLGMANLLGQLGMQKNPAASIPLLRRAADLVDLDVPQPAYVFGMLMLGEFDQVDIPIQLLMATLPPATPENRDPRQNEARRRIERAAYFNFAPAQYKLGLAYENAQLGCPFDPLLSVQYYSLASQQGEVEADMALSKWFLCGHAGAFDKDETLAVTFAEKAAKKGLPSAEFAMGYYCEVGVGGAKDVAAARKWYQLAAQHKNPDAADRLKALSQPTPAALSRAEHDKLTDATLVRKRTNARDLSMAAGRGTGERRANGTELSDVRRMAEEAKKTLGANNNPASRSPKSHDTRPLSDDFSPPHNPGQRPLPGATGSMGQAGRGGGRFAGAAKNPERGASPSRQAQQQQQYPGRDSRGHTPPPHDHHQPHSNGGSPGRPKLADHNRGYSLSDTTAHPQGNHGGHGGGGGGPARGGKGHRNTSGPTGGAPANPGVSTGPTGRPRVYDNQSKKGPATFAEMGFQSRPVEDKDCIIM